MNPAFFFDSTAIGLASEGDFATDSQEDLPDAFVMAMGDRLKINGR
jgi:hypothetical protein